MTVQSASVALPVRTLTFAIIGNPNTGKSSLFNALTGGNAAVGNYAGVTVDLKKGKFRVGQQPITLIDLPGTYSLTARSLDEKISVDAIAHAVEGIESIDGVVVVLDATAIERNLYLLSQVLESDLPVLVVANMWDRLGKSGVDIDLELLKSRLGVPVVTTCAAKRQGIDELRAALVELGTSASKEVDRTLTIFPPALEQSVASMQKWFADRDLELHPFQVRRLILDAGTGIQNEVLTKLTNGQHAESLANELKQAVEQLGTQGLRLPSEEPKHRYADSEEVGGSGYSTPTQ